MNQTIMEQTLPVYVLQIKRTECCFDSMGEIVAHIKQQIEENRTARFIAIFDHYAHTKGLPEGQLDENIQAAVNIIFCFGLTLPEPSQLANRPRSIGICETADEFTISFIEAPMPVANAVIETWVKSLCLTPVTT